MGEKLKASVEGKEIGRVKIMRDEGKKDGHPGEKEYWTLGG